MEKEIPASEMYKEHILEHYKHPQNFGILKDADINQRESNPLCGDELEFWIKIKGNKISDVRFRGKGCAISIASASMMSDEIKGKKLSEIVNMKNSEVIALLGIPISVSRYKCAILSIMTVKAGIDTYKKAMNKK